MSQPLAIDSSENNDLVTESIVEQLEELEIQNDLNESSSTASTNNDERIPSDVKGSPAKGKKNLFSRAVKSAGETAKKVNVKTIGALGGKKTSMDASATEDDGNVENGDNGQPEKNDEDSVNDEAKEGNDTANDRKSSLTKGKKKALKAAKMVKRFSIGDETESWRDRKLMGGIITAGQLKDVTVRASATAVNIVAPGSGAMVIKAADGVEKSLVSIAAARDKRKKSLSDDSKEKPAADERKKSLSEDTKEETAGDERKKSLSEDIKEETADELTKDGESTTELDKQAPVESESKPVPT